MHHDRYTSGCDGQEVRVTAMPEPKRTDTGDVGDTEEIVDLVERSGWTSIMLRLSALGTLKQPSAPGVGR